MMARQLGQSHRSIVEKLGSARLASQWTEATRVLDGFRRFASWCVWRPSSAVRTTKQDFGNLLVSARGGRRCRSRNWPGPATTWDGSRLPAKTGNVVFQSRLMFEGGKWELSRRRRRPPSLAKMRLPTGCTGAVCESIWKAPQQAADRRASDILLVFMLLFAAFHSARLAALVFTGVPFAVTGRHPRTVLARHAVFR